MNYGFFGGIYSLVYYVAKTVLSENIGNVQGDVFKLQQSKTQRHSEKNKTENLTKILILWS